MVDIEGFSTSNSLKLRPEENTSTEKMDKEPTGLMGGIRGRTKRVSRPGSDTEVNKTKDKRGGTELRRQSLNYAGINVGSGSESRRTRSNSRSDQTSTASSPTAAEDQGSAI